jgi:hypothetical protein
MPARRSTDADSSTSASTAWIEPASLLRRHHDRARTATRLGRVTHGRPVAAATLALAVKRVP